MEFTLETVVFYVLAVFIAVMSILTVTTRRIVRSATYLLMVLLSTSIIYFLLGYAFLGAVQIMVYAGGIVVLYVFSILLTSGEGDKPMKRVRGGKLLAGILATVCGAGIVLFITLTHRFASSPDLEPLAFDIKSVGYALLSTDKYGYMLPFEVMSLLLLACIVGGLMIARKR